MLFEQFGQPIVLPIGQGRGNANMTQEPRCLVRKRGKAVEQRERRRAMMGEGPSHDRHPQSKARRDRAPSMGIGRNGQRVIAPVGPKG